jgi:hypothetical protein
LPPGTTVTTSPTGTTTLTLPSGFNQLPAVPGAGVAARGGGGGGAVAGVTVDPTLPADADDNAKARADAPPSARP